MWGTEVRFISGVRLGGDLSLRKLFVQHELLVLRTSNLQYLCDVHFPGP